jgi:hypothetical protein
MSIDVENWNKTNNNIIKSVNILIDTETGLCNCKKCEIAKCLEQCLEEECIIFNKERRVCDICKICTEK